MTTKIDKKQEKVDNFPHLKNQSEEFQKMYQQLQSLNNSGLNTSGLNTSGVKAKKKTQNIYPLDHTNQQVQIKLVMAQLTNNKELIGTFLIKLQEIWTRIALSTTIVKNNKAQL